MNKLTITGAQLREMVIAGAALLEKNKDAVDALNVFPVPDGDTGTNMSMTMASAVHEVRALPEDAPLDQVASALSMGALRGARGNSGVILSQLFRGFSKACKNETLLDGKLLAKALSMGADAAYKAVMKPKEGTILTVARRSANHALELAEQGENVYRVFDGVLEACEVALAETPELLPVLKEAGVVDSGGKGLLTIYRGFKLAMDGEEVADYVEPETQAPQLKMNNDSFSGESIEFGYCTEFFIIHPPVAFKEEEVNNFRDHLNRLGDCVVVAMDEDVVKVHVHSNAPGKVLQMALRLGELDRLKIENMREQNRKLMEERKKNEKELALISVSAGEGLDLVFQELGVDAIVSGGQTMNPSIDTINQAIEQVNARNVIILPNNSNIILAAQQAANLSKRNVIVIPTKTIPQGISAAMAYEAESPAKEVAKAMEDAVAEVVSGAVTYAVRDTKIEGSEVHKNDILGLMDNRMTVVNTDVEEGTLALIKAMMEKKEVDDATVTLFYGEDVTEEQARETEAIFAAACPDAEISLLPGGQPVYYYMISAE